MQDFLLPETKNEIDPSTIRIGHPTKDTDSSGVTNSEFISVFFPQVPDGAFVAVCTKPGDPTGGGWLANRGDTTTLPADNNNYISCSSFYPCEDGNFKARKAQFAAYHFLMLDDLGSKIPMEKLGSFELSCLIETSPGNFQGMIILAEPITDIDVAEGLLKAVIDAGLCDEGASGLTRWARLPEGINGKEKYRDENGNPFRCRLKEWNPSKRYTPEEIVAGLQLELSVKKTADSDIHHDADRTDENPVITALRDRGLYKTPLGSGKHDITCPWVHEHTDALDTGSAYFEPDESYPGGGFCCQHSHRDKYHIRELLKYLEIQSEEVQKTLIRISPGELHRVVDAAELELANHGRHYQSGGLIVSIATDPATGDPSIQPISSSALTRRLSEVAIWEKYIQNKGKWIRCDPPTRHTGILYDSGDYRHLLPLVGVARQPYFRESDNELVMEPGYDKVSNFFGVFDPQQYVLPEPTEEAARSALALLEDLLVEFHFVSPADKAAALSAIFTAVVRPTLSHAPAYHVRAPVFGSGKSYLCELIGAFAGPGGNAKVSYPRTSEEATKTILSLLLTNPAVIEFDDMDTDWIPHGVILRMLTAEHITDRILGHSKTATVSTRSLFLGSGNNVGPVKDLLRRVLTIHIDPRTSTPAMLSYKRKPVEKVQQHRGKYIAAVLTIILAWRKCGLPRSDTESIVSFDGAWSEYCRQPLMWLGHPDPAKALLDQIKHDPDAEALGNLMSEWHRAFGSTPTTVRKAVDEAGFEGDLLDAIREFPVEERGTINRSKLGWVLKKNANRIVDGMEFQKAQADGRNAWRVVETNKGVSK
jgi:hypothetical protein